MDIKVPALGFIPIPKQNKNSEVGIPKAFFT
jgi:hypothetical protein